MKQKSIAAQPTGLSHPSYRPDIDGLRAIAVLGVVIYHAFPKVVKGGFIGVDVFFVISGYLISTIIFKSLDNGTFSFSEFYVRRIKRIFPALILVLTSCFIFGWFTLLADEYEQLGKHIAGGASFISNFILLQETGYFDISAAEKPLIHLWSLGVEEQFYLTWPLLLWFAWKNKFNLFSITMIVTAISFYLNIRGVYRDSNATFYSPQTRLWELMTGSLLSWIILDRKNKIFWKGNNVRNLLNIISFTGLTLLVYGFSQLDKNLAFPGYYALVPVIGTTFLIAAGPDTWINRNILSSRIAVWFGLISFPLYLWHWPLLSFSNIFDVSSRGRNIALPLSVFLAWLTYKLLELPIRKSKSKKYTTYILIFLMLLIGFVGYKTYANNGLINRNAAQLKEFRSGDIGNFNFFNLMATNNFLCNPNNIASKAPKAQGVIRCMQSKKDVDINIALVGDSHSEHLFLGLSHALPKKNIVYYLADSSSYLSNPKSNEIFKSIFLNKSINIVILSYSWEAVIKSLSTESSPDIELIKLVDTLREAGKKVYFTDDVPIFPFHAKKCKGKRWGRLKETSCDISYTNMKIQTDSYIRFLNKVADARPAVQILGIGKYLCDKDLCSMAKGNELLYRDGSHLNINGSLLVGRKLVEDNPNIFK